MTQELLTDGFEVERCSPQRYFTDARRNGDQTKRLLRGSVPTLQEEVWYWELVIAETSLGLERAQNGREKARLRRHLRSAVQKHKKAVRRLAALEREQKCMMSMTY